MTAIVATAVDVTRNENGEVLLSVMLSAASTFADPALLLRQEGGAWRAGLRDRLDPSASLILLPPLPLKAAEWIAAAPPFRRAADPAQRLEGDTRVEGVRYALVCEIVGEQPVNGYFARLTPLAARG